MHFNMGKKLAGSDHFWKMRLAKCAPDCRELDFHQNSRKIGTFVAVARNCPYCERCACSGKTHMHACKPQSESDAATLLASGIAAGGYETHCKSYTTLRGERNWVAEAIEEPAGRQLKSRIAQISSCSEKKHIAERRGASAKGSVSEEVAQQRKVAHSSIHPSTQVSASFANAFSEVVCARALLTRPCRRRSSSL